MKQNNIMVGLGIIAIVILGVLTFQSGQTNVVVQQPGEAGISVTGEAQAAVMPDQAKIRVSVETERSTAKAAQDQNTATSDKVIAALKAAGVDSDDLATTSYQLYEQYDYREGTRTSTGYVASHTIEITVQEISKVGELLSVAVSNGANRVDTVRFTLSEEAEANTRETLLEEAGQAAREKAEAIAEELGVSVGKVLSVNENSYNPPIYYARAEAYDMVASSAPAIAPEQVDVQIQLHVVFAVD